jgi:hypothetical protein
MPAADVVTEPSTRLLLLRPNYAQIVATLMLCSDCSLVRSRTHGCPLLFRNLATLLIYPLPYLSVKFTKEKLKRSSETATCASPPPRGSY